MEMGRARLWWRGRGAGERIFFLSLSIHSINLSLLSPNLLPGRARRNSVGAGCWGGPADAWSGPPARSPPVLKGSKERVRGAKDAMRREEEVRVEGAVGGPVLSSLSILSSLSLSNPHQAAIDVLQVHQLDGDDLVVRLAHGAPDLVGGMRRK